MALVRLQHLIGCQERHEQSEGETLYVTCVSASRVHQHELVPSDSATITVKYFTAPLASLNHEQLKRNKMEDDVSLDDLSLTRTLGGGTGGPEGTRTSCQSNEGQDTLFTFTGC